jgi:hypothetical protein
MSSTSSGGEGTDRYLKTVINFVMSVFAVATVGDVALQVLSRAPTEATKHAIDLLDFIAKTTLGTILGFIGGGSATRGR